MIGDRPVTVRPALDDDGYYAVCEEFPDIAGFGATRQDAVADLAEAIENAKNPAAADETSVVLPQEEEPESPPMFITPVMAVCGITGNPGDALPEDGPRDD